MTDKVVKVMEKLIEDTTINCPDCIARIIVTDMAIDILSSVRAKTKKEQALLDEGIEMLKGTIPAEECNEQSWQNLRECADYILKQRRTNRPE